MKKDIDNLLKRDSLAEAEKITGKSYKNDKQTIAIGMIDSINNSREKESILQEMDDTCFSETEQEYLRKVKKMGFKTLLIEPFLGRNGIEERLYIMFHEKYSIFLRWDTFHWDKESNPTRNSASIYYNWKPNNNNTRLDCTESGGYRKHNNQFVWVGNHDGREALGHKINMLLKNGSFFKKWVECPFIWLLNYVDTESEDYDYESINKERLSKLPKEVQEIVNYKPA